jgi:hypothetical protein
MAQDHKELAYSVLLLERQLESYQKLHLEEMEALWKTLAELKKRIRILGMESSDTDVEQTSVSTSHTSDSHHSS